MVKEIKTQLKNRQSDDGVAGCWTICEDRRAIFRLPEIRDACLVLINRQHVLETERIPELQAAILALSHRQHALETGQIPALQESISSSTTA